MPKALEGEISQSEGARRLGLTKQAIGLWTAKPGAPVRRDGNHVFLRWPDFARWRELEMKKSADARKNGAPGKEADPNSPMQRKMLAEAVTAEHEEKLKAIELAKALEQTISLSDHEEVVGRILDRLIARLRAMPIDFAHLGPLVERAVEEEVEKVIVELNKFDEDVIDEDDEDADPDDDEEAVAA